VNVSQAGPLVLRGARLVALPVLQPLVAQQQGPRRQPQEPPARWPALQESGHGECRRHRSAGLPAVARPQEEQLECARPQA